MARMRAVSPKMQALKEQFGDDRQKMSQAMMELYKKEKINPLGGCLPILVQMPVFLALYWVLLESVEMRQAPWMFWITDLSIKDPYFILPIIMGVTMFIQQQLNPTPTPMQARVMKLLPIIFTFFLWFPAGAVLGGQQHPVHRPAVVHYAADRGRGETRLTPCPPMQNAPDWGVLLSVAQKGGRMIPARDTIAAVATAPGRGGVGIVRVSGPRARAIAITLSGREPTPRHAHYGPFHADDGEVIDEGLLLFFPARIRSPARMCWNCTAMAARWCWTCCCSVVSSGVRPPDREFSERAFLNDKLDSPRPRPLPT